MRGCQRQIIMLKGTDSQIFDEAYFLLRKDFDRSRGSEGELVREEACYTSRSRIDYPLPPETEITEED